MSSVLSSAKIFSASTFNAAAAFFKNVGYTVTTPAGAFIAVASAAIGGVAVCLFNRVSSSNRAAADVAAAAGSDRPLSANVTSGEAASVSALFNRVTTSVKGWANSFVSFLSGLVPSFLRSKTEEAVDADASEKVVDAEETVKDASEKVVDAEETVKDASEKVVDAEETVKEASEKVVDTAAANESDK